MLSPFRRCLSTYVLGSEARELSRLGIQHGVFAGRTRDLYQTLNVQLGDSVIDLGCGPGFTTLELAQIVGSSGTVFAMDSSLTSLQVLSKRAEREGWIATSFCRLEHQDFGAIVSGEIVIIKKSGSESIAIFKESNPPLYTSKVLVYL